MKAADLPIKARYVAAWRLCKDLAAADPATPVTGLTWWPEPASKALGRFREALHLRINSRGGLPTRWDQLRWDQWRRDQIAIREFRLQRIVRPGSGLETKAGRRIARDVHERFREVET